MITGVWKTENSPKLALRAHGSSAAKPAMATSTHGVARQDRQQRRAEQDAEQRAGAALHGPGEHRPEVGLEHDRDGQQHPVGPLDRQVLAGDLGDGHAQRQADGEGAALGAGQRAVGQLAQPRPPGRPRARTAAAPARSSGSPTTFHTSRTPCRTARRARGAVLQRRRAARSGSSRSPSSAAASAWTAATSVGSAGTPARAAATAPSTSGAAALSTPASSDSSRLRPAEWLRLRMTRS